MDEVRLWLYESHRRRSRSPATTATAQLPSLKTHSWRSSIRIVNINYKWTCNTPFVPNINVRRLPPEMGCDFVTSSNLYWVLFRYHTKTCSVLSNSDWQIYTQVSVFNIPYFNWEEHREPTKHSWRVCWRMNTHHNIIIQNRFEVSSKSMKQTVLLTLELPDSVTIIRQINI